MTFKEIVNKLGKKSKARKAKFKELEENFRLRQMLEERQKSANERELERFQDEEREEGIKEALEFHRKKRQHDIMYNHNPLDTPNITKETQWNVLKEKNQFTNNKNIFTQKGNIHKSSKELLKNNKKLLTGGNMFKI